MSSRHVIPGNNPMSHNLPEDDDARSSDDAEMLDVEEERLSDYHSIDEEHVAPRMESVTALYSAEKDDASAAAEGEDRIAELQRQSKPFAKRGSKVFTRLVTFMRPLRRSVSLSLRLGRRTTSTDVVTLQQFTEALDCRGEILPKRIYKVLRRECEEVTKDLLVDATRGTFDTSVRFAFDVYDFDGDGEISEEDYRAALRACLEENGIILDPCLFEKALNVAMESLDSEQTGGIQFERFQECLESSLDTVADAEMKESGLWPMIAVPSGSLSTLRRRGEKLLKYTAKLRYRILNNLQKYSLWTLSILICILCFYWRFSMYAESDKRKLMSWSLPVAKGMGQVMKFCFAVILIPVSRNFITWLRTSWLSAVLPFDDAIAYHKFIGIVGFIAATVHTLCHVVDVLNWSDSDRRDLYERAFPGTDQPTFWELCSMQVAVTGILLYLIMCIAYTFALDYPRRWSRLEHTRIGEVLNNFNNFWYTHHLFAAFYVLLLIHPTPGIPNEAKEWGISDFWAWGGVPILVYLLERGIRIYRQGSWQTRILYNAAISDDTVTIYLSKPRRFHAKAGMYVFLNCPEIAQFEWHPYTMTSAPQDDHIRVHIASLGDWSSAMCRRFATPMTHQIEPSSSSPSMKTDDAPWNAGTLHPQSAVVTIGVGGDFDADDAFDPQSYFSRTSMLSTTQLAFAKDNETTRIFVDGPYGAPSQEFDQFSTVMLIGAGIGITPFASIIRDILSRFDEHRCVHCGKVSLGKSFRIKKVYFIWVVRDPQRALWFNKELYALKKDDQHGVLDIRIFITGLYSANDVRSKLLHMTQQVLFEKCEIDLLTGARACSLTSFGRPNWDAVFEDVRQNHPRTTVGVFFCGQYVLSQTLEKTCRKFSDKNGTKFEYMYERF